MSALRLASLRWAALGEMYCSFRVCLCHAMPMKMEVNAFVRFTSRTHVWRGEMQFCFATPVLADAGIALQGSAPPGCLDVLTVPCLGQSIGRKVGRVAYGDSCVTGYM